MIVRVLHEGQFELDGETMAKLRQLDDAWMESLTKGDKQRFAELRDEIVGVIREKGRALPDDTLRESDLIVPQSDITMEEALKLFSSAGA